MTPGELLRPCIVLTQGVPVGLRITCVPRGRCIDLETSEFADDDDADFLIGWVCAYSTRNAKLLVMRSELFWMFGWPVLFDGGDLWCRIYFA